MSGSAVDELYHALKRLKFDAATGELIVPGLGDILIFLSLSFRAMVKWTARKFGGGSSMIWYNVGKASAAPIVGLFQRIKAEEDTSGLVGHLDAYATIIGWGKVQTTAFRPAEKTAVIRISNSPLTRGLDNSHGCDFIRGYLAGIYDVVFEANTFCDEVLCESRGAKYCEFHVACRQSWPR